MTTFVNSTGREMAEAGHRPRSFWINSMGEYGHVWDNDTQTVAGSTNLKQAAEEAGLQWEPPFDVPDAVVRRAEKRALHRELIDPREHILMRAWNAVEPAGSDLWRFMAGGEYSDGSMVNYRLTLTIEYIIHQDRAEELKTLATAHGATAEAMWEDREPGQDQYSVDWEVLGKSLPEILKLQLDWLHAARTFDGTLLSVI